MPSTTPAIPESAPVIDLDAAGGVPLEALQEQIERPTEPEPAPFIEPPKSFSADEREYFAKLSPELQAAVVERERGREAHFRRRQNDAAELQKKLTAEHAAALQTRMAAERQAQEELNQ